MKSKLKALSISNTRARCRPCSAKHGFHTDVERHPGESPEQRSKQLAMRTFSTFRRLLFKEEPYHEIIEKSETNVNTVFSIK